MVGITNTESAVSLPNRNISMDLDAAAVSLSCNTFPSLTMLLSSRVFSFFLQQEKNLAGATGETSWLLAPQPGPLTVASPESFLGFIASDPNPDLGHPQVT